MSHSSSPVTAPVVVGTCRALDGFEPDLRCRSDDAEVQFELIRRMVRWD